MRTGGNIVGNRLRELRRAQKLSLRDLSGLVGINRGNISRLESGETALTVSYAARLARVLGEEIRRLVSPAQFVLSFDDESAERREDLDEAARAFLRGMARQVTQEELRVQVWELGGAFLLIPDMIAASAARKRSARKGATKT